jgi:hydroxymethylglutaryl-CoA synthase
LRWRREASGEFVGPDVFIAMLEKTGLKPSDFAYAIFHQPNGKFPLRAAKALGFTKEQIEPGWLSPRLGNTYSGSSPMGLTATLDVAKAGDRIFMVSYGSGAGSDAFVFTVTDLIDSVRNLAPSTAEQLDEKQNYIDYGTYAKFRRKIRKGE